LRCFAISLALWPALAGAQPVPLAPSGLFLLPMQHAGDTAAFVFDTGSSLTVIDTGRPDLARPPTPPERTQFASLRLGLPPDQARAVRLAVSRGLRYAGTTLPEGEPVLLADLHPISTALGAAIAGLLGLADIRRRAWTIEDHSLRPGADDATAGCMAPVQDSRTWITLPATFGPLTVAAQLDTGSNVFLRLSAPTLAALDRLHLLRAGGAAQGFAIGGRFSAAAFRLAGLRVGSAAFADVPVLAAETDALGLPFLLAFRRAVLDLPHSRLCFMLR
jgi:hypothetical protein